VELKLQISEIIKSATAKEKRADSTVYISEYLGKKIVIKKSSVLGNILNEIDVVSFLYSSNFPTYKIINNEFEGSRGYIVYEYIDGKTGFDIVRNNQYFYDVGMLIGDMQNILEKYSKNKSKYPIIHGDLHSGNIIENNNIKYIIDFSTVKYGNWFIDLLNIEYEIAHEIGKYEKEQSFIDGYSLKRTITYPNIANVISEIMKNDNDEYVRHIAICDKNTEYFRNLEYCVKHHKPTFIPKWCKLY
jgi:tRNA A-37 threonylcarbamoyl transferase component Bud32